MVNFPKSTEGRLVEALFAARKRSQSEENDEAGDAVAMTELLRSLRDFWQSSPATTPDDLLLAILAAGGQAAPEGVSPKSAVSWARDALAEIRGKS